ncbi:sodium:solute symporter family protein [Roseibacillus ishigakijimensis]|uniref:Na+:solute symporter n=1 Tax=Roseibacillus ishigakijimensis TaxID=454146 RepID=A0A934VHA7_9BACT|nr:sodium:solute symporter family protein [Roseibacillus ishigakijimensis]MBK1833733.1 Na+:solute symporter [Roseibacillus ishigakijimensis]
MLLCNSSLVSLSFWDWLIIATVLAISLLIGLVTMKKAGKSTSDFFLSGRNMPWWLLGVSMVATTFAADTPNLVTQIVRENGVAGNWVWWAFILSAMLTTFVFARLWRRSAVMTDIEFYELRYSGKAASFLRGFRALYLGVIFNTMVMASVNLAAIKFGTVLLGLAPWQTLLMGCGITVIYSSLGGLRGILATDFFQFMLAMAGSLGACCYLLNLPEAGGLTAMLAHENVLPKLALFPDFSNWDLVMGTFLVPLLVLWWSSYYPGAEPGGGGYTAQRMLSAKNENHALGATLFFNIAHYALRPWPWILVALTSLIFFPSTEDLAAALPAGHKGLAADDIAYPLMLTKLPAGLLGLVMASLIAAYMSTISTQLNIGSSYLTHDFYRRFLKPAASEKELVWVGRLFTFLIIFLAALLSLVLDSSTTAFQLLVLVGAGSGLIYLLRWLWWRVNATAEIIAMAVSFLAASFFVLVYPRIVPEGAQMANYWQNTLVVAITTVSWILGACFGPRTDPDHLRAFVARIRPPGPGWKPFAAASSASPDASRQLPLALFASLLGVMAVLGTLLGTGYWLYRAVAPACVCSLLALASIGGLLALRKKL